MKVNNFKQCPDCGAKFLGSKHICKKLCYNDGRKVVMKKAKGF